VLELIWMDMGAATGMAGEQHQIPA
jgi:hypothetical protein